jgi:hypothetical protein
MPCPFELIFGGTEGVGSSFYVLRSRTRFLRYRGRWVQFSCFALLDPIWAVPRASGQVLCFTFLYPFSAVPSSSDPVIMFLAPRLAFGGIEGVRSSFHVLHSRAHFLRYQGRRVQFSCFALPDLFSAIPRVSGLVFMFCAPRPDLGGTESDGSSFHVLRSRTRFWRYRGRQIPFSCFALPDLFSVVPRASSPVFKNYTLKYQKI